MTGLRYAYGTNGLTDHRLGEALELLADVGYDGVSLTLDHHHLDPHGPDLAGRVAAVRRDLDRTGLDVVVETGARFVLDPRRKHHPTLLSDDADGRDRRVALLRTAIAVASELGTDVVHLWSGHRPDHVTAERAWSRLVDGLATLVDEADRAGVTLAFEPEPGMLVATIDDWRRLAADLGDPAAFAVTLDVGHVLCLETLPVHDRVAEIAPRVAHVQIDDHRRGTHEHLPFGDGELDLPPVLGALHAAAYGGLVSVELARHGHDAHRQVPRSLAALRAAERDALDATTRTAPTRSGPTAVPTTSPATEERA